MAEKLVQADPFRDLDMKSRQQLWKNAHYTPQPYQLAMHEQMHFNAKAITGGIGAGKTITTVQDYAHEAVSAVHRANMGYSAADGFNGRIAIVGPNYKLAQVAFNYLEQIWMANGIIAIPPTKAINRSWRMLSKSNVEAITVSSSDPMAFAAAPYTVVHITEAGQVPLEILDAAMERTSRWPGPHSGMVYLDGTFEELGERWYPRVCEAWSIEGNTQNGKFFSFPAWENTYNFPGGFEGTKIQTLFHHYEARGQLELFWTRVGGKIPAQKSDLWSTYFQPQRHVKELQWNKQAPVDFTFDPGTHKYAGLFLQWNDDETELYVLDQLVQERTDFNRYRTAWLNKPYTKNITPQYSTVVCDVASTIHGQGLDSTYDMWKAPRNEGGMGITPKYEYMHKSTGLQVLMTGLDGEYYKIFIDPKCTDLLMNLREEVLNEQGDLDHIRNKGKDDSRKALSYYLGIKKGTALGKSARKQFRQTPQSRTRTGMSINERRQA